MAEDNQEHLHSAEQLEESELVDEIEEMVTAMLEGKNHALIRTPGDIFIHLNQVEGGLGLSVEPPFDLETEMYTTDALLIKEGEITGSLDIVPTEELNGAREYAEDVHDALERERERTEAAREMGFGDRKLSRAELEKLYLDLKRATVEGRSDI